MEIDTKNSQSLPEPVIYNQYFLELDEVLEILGIDNNYNTFQLESGSFKNKLNFINFGDWQVTKGISNRAIQIDPEKPSDFVQFSFLYDPDTSPVVLGNVRLNAQYFWGFDPYKAAPLIIPANVEVASVFIRQSYFQDYLQQMNYPELATNLPLTDYIHVPQVIPTVQSYLHDLFQLTENNPNLLLCGCLTRLIQEDFIPLLIQAISSSPSFPVAPVTSHLRNEIVKKAKDYMMDNLHKPITLKDLCKNLYVSSRSLIYGFQEILGTSPMNYLKILRLHGVRQALKQADPTQTNVKAIANQFGFWSMGHFTRDYKSFFGELPSITLKS
ncbi:MAG: helix-turn-helix domain-containing protein [Snowella sp.]|nr:helix-turn-helix domain-containing protein [Snowella sp.]